MITTAHVLLRVMRSVWLPCLGLSLGLMSEPIEATATPSLTPVTQEPVLWRWSLEERPTRWPSSTPVSPLVGARSPQSLMAEWSQLETLTGPKHRGLAQLGLRLSAFRAGQYHSAVEALTRAGDSALPLQDLQLFLWGESLFHLGRYRDAQSVLERLQSEHKGSLWGHKASFRLADIKQALGEPQESASMLKRLLKRYPEYPYTKAALLSQGLNELASGRPRAAIEAWEALTPGSPQDVSVHLAEGLLGRLQRLTGLTSAVQAKAQLRRVIEWKGWKYYGRALSEVRALKASLNPQDKLWQDVALEEVRVLNKMERFEEAYQLNKELKTTLDRRHQRTNNWWASEALFRLGRVEEAGEAFKRSRISKRSPGNLARLGMIYFNGARYKEALEAFEEAHKRGEKGDPDLWMARRLRSWLLYRVGDYRAAIRRFGNMGGTRRGRNSYAMYWRARSLQKRALELETLAQSSPETKRATRKKAAAVKKIPRYRQEALDLYKRIIERAPTSYYAYVSAARLRQANEPFERSWLEHPSELTPARQPQIAPIPDPLTSITPLAQRYGAELSAWEAVYGLTLIGERRWAAIYLRSLFEEHKAYHRAGGRERRRWSFAPKFYLDYRDDEEYGIWGERAPTRAVRSKAWANALRQERPTQLFHKLEGAFRGLDDHYNGRRRSHYDGPKLTYPERPEEASEWQRRYPRSFRVEVEQSAARHGVDPHLIWALMTVESSHNPWAISRVGARGLMQVMPHTGQLSADRLSWPYFGSPLLFEPEVAVEMAAWYFKELSANFKGQLPLAMAAYNAGPHRVKVWLEVKGALPLDELIEEIPYAQAREYAKKVTRHLALYRRIYQGHTGHLLDLVVNPVVEGNVNF